MYVSFNSPLPSCLKCEKKKKHKIEPQALNLATAYINYLNFQA